MVQLPLPLHEMWRSALSIALVIVLQVYLLGPELYKLPVLFAHYLEHAATDESFDMDAFVHLHYVDHGHGENGDTDHERLPFHHHHHGTTVDQCFGQVYLVWPQHALSFPSLAARSVTVLPVVPDLRSGHNSELLRPPRILA